MKEVPVAQKVFVHGVPETDAVWAKVAAALDEEIVSLQLPGFSCPRPEGFRSSMQEYADWLATVVAEFPEPIHIVGHDWGGILVARLASSNPHNLVSWCSDAAASLQQGFVWHDLALLWQSEPGGEEFFEAMMADVAASAELLTAYGLSLEDATAMVEAFDPVMAASILALYRSADGIGEAWAISGPVVVPGLCCLGESDPFGTVGGQQSMAARIGATFALIEGAGHFWPLQAPEAGAEMLTRWWSQVEARK